MKYIYALIDPRTRQIRYVGQTDDLTKRLQQHITDKSNTPKIDPKKNDSTLVLKKVLCVVSVAEFLLGFIVFFAR